MKLGQHVLEGELARLGPARVDAPAFSASCRFLCSPHPLVLPRSAFCIGLSALDPDARVFPDLLIRTTKADQPQFNSIKAPAAGGSLFVN
jgi:hypothetical protein